MNFRLPLLRSGKTRGRKRPLLARRHFLQRGSAPSRSLACESLESRILLTAVRNDLPGFSSNTLPDEPDASSGPVDIGFAIDFDGMSYDELFVNENGNVTFGDSFQGIPTRGSGEFVFEPTLGDLGIPIMASFWADVDAVAQGSVTYGRDEIDGRAAFGVTWTDVGYAVGNNDLSNIFQLVLIDRSDVERGAFDIEFNYDQVQWETGDRSGGDDGFFGASARVGYSSGTGEPGTFLELVGSGADGSLLDSNDVDGLIFNSLNSDQDGRYVLNIRDTFPGGSNDGLWQNVDGIPDPPSPDIESFITADAAIFTLNTDLLRNVLWIAPDEFSGRTPVRMSLPRPDGSFDDYDVFQSQIMEPGLADQLPDTRTYAAQSVSNPLDVMRFDLTPAGFHALVLAPAGAQYVVPYFHLDDSFYAAYFSRDNVDPNEFLPEGEISIPLGAEPAPADHPVPERASVGPNLRTYRLAVAATGEYTEFHSSPGAASAVAAQNAVVTAVNLVNNIYEQEFGVRFILVANNLILMETDPATDPYTNDNPSMMLDENQMNLDMKIMDANYDVGHVFGTRPGGGYSGVANVGAGQAGLKARGVSTHDSPIGNDFSVRLISHEMGHQFSAGHTWSGDSGNCSQDQFASNSAAEPGGGSSIMGYVGNCGAVGDDSLQTTPDDYFHGRSIEQVIGYITGTIPGVGNTIATGNGVPTVDAGADFTIPARTPFELTATANDPDGDPLLYSWEQRDLAGMRFDLPAGDMTTNPIIRSFDAVESPIRTIPQLQDILDGTSTLGILLPTTDRAVMQFEVTVRDRQVGFGAVDQDIAQMTVEDTGAPFAVTGPIAAAVWGGGTNQMVSWDVSGTDAAPISAAGVDIFLSTDGGQTFPISLANNVANDGSHEVAVPNLTTTQARVKVRGANNIFFNINNGDFRIVETDRFEENDTIETATVLGSVPEITLRDLTIHSESDVDYFKVTANQTGKLVVNSFFVHDDGDLELEIRDANDVIIRNSTTSSDNEQIIIPVVGQEMYFVRVVGFNGAINEYALEIENFAAPVPTDVTLDPNDDSGMSNFDPVTLVANARLFIKADLFDFAQMNIPMLDADDALEGTNPGAAVEVFVNGASVGFASPFGGLPTLWEFTLDVTAGLDPDVGQWSQAIPISTGRGVPNARLVADDNAGFFNIVQAAVRIFDGQNGGEGAGATGRSQLSEELDVHFDPNAPNIALATIGMLDASDSSAGDLITSKMQPAFAGVAEANAKVRVFAERVVAGVPVGVPELIGEGVVGSDSSDGVLGDGLGQWEVTVEPLRDDVYDITAEFEDLAGNVSERTDGLRIEVDSRLPQRPTVDLVGMDVQDPQANVADLPAIMLIAPVFSDTGMDTMDDVTRGTNPLNPGGQGTTDVQLRISAEPNSLVFVKDGETVIASFVMPPVLNDFVFLTVSLDEDPHPISVEAFDAAGNRSHQSEELLVTIDVTPPPTPAAPNMINASDTGMDQTDNVTSKMSPAFDGRAEKNDKIRIFADRVINGVPQNTPVLVGQGVVNSDETDGSPPANPLNNLGTWEITIEPLGNGVYDMTVELEDLAGNISSRSEGLRIEIDAQQPNTPFLDLVEMDDTGRHNDDNITNITLVRNPTFRMTTDDHTADPTMPPDHLIAENFKYRIFDRAETGGVGNQQLQPEVLLFDSFTSLGNLFTSATLLTRQLSQVLNMPGGLALADGIHNLKLEVEDRAGNISEDFLLDVLIDTEAFLGQPEFDPDSDSGIWGFPDTMEDNITSDKTPSFFGTAEADNIVTITINGTPAGTAVAIPLDGDDAFRPPNDPYDLVEGNWLIETNLNLLDGEHAAVLTFEDPAGNRVSADPILFFVDTQGPRITNVTHGDVSTDGVFTLDEDTTSVFQPKPDGGPDPLISSIVIHFSDLPLRTANFPYEALFRALAEEEGNYSLIGDANGHIPILDVDVSFDTPINGVDLATARVELIFHDPAAGLFTGAGAPLPDDRFTLFVSDSIADPVGNPLDGESGAAAPFDGNDVPLATPPIFPTGDGEHGGDFIGRFTVDSRPEIGVWAGRSVYIDTNGNFFYDPENPDDTNEDINYTLGILSDNVFAGNFAETGNIADGFDKLAAYGRFNGAWRFLVDTDNDGVPEDLDGDGVPGVVNPLGINGLPVAGNFDGIAANGDEVGIFDGDTWWLDVNHNFQAATPFASNLIGYPIVGDFDGDGFDDLATWHDDTFDHFSIDLANGVANGWDGNADHIIHLDFAGERERPVAADMDGDGFDDLGLWVADRSGATPKEAAEWYFLVSHGDSVLDRIENDDRGLPTIPFTPEPFGNDLFALFGDDDALPIVGNFDPPVVVGENISIQPYYTYDLNGDGAVSPLDALLVISALPNQGVNSSGAPQGADSLRYDVDGDGVVSPLDALLVIAQLGQGDISEAGEIAAGPLPHRELGQDVSDAATTAVFAAGSRRAGGEDGFDNRSASMDVRRPVGALSLAQSQPGQDSKTVDRVFEELAAELSWQRDRVAPAYRSTLPGRGHAERIAGSVPQLEPATRVRIDLSGEDLVDEVSRRFL